MLYPKMTSENDESSFFRALSYVHCVYGHMKWMRWVGCRKIDSEKHFLENAMGG